MWIEPAILATLTGTLILTLVYAYLYAQEKKIYLKVWAICWGIYSLRFVFAFSLLHYKNPLLFAGNLLSAILSAAILLYGTFLFLEKHLKPFWIISTGLVSLWAVFGIIVKMDFLMLTVPIYAFTGTCNIFTGISLIESKKIKSKETTVVGVFFILWGIHKYDYPFVRPLEWFAPYGFLLGALFSFCIAIGCILIYFRLARAETHRNYIKYRSLIEKSQDAIITHTPIGKIIDCNPQAAELFGYTVEEFLTLQVPDLIHPSYRNGYFLRQNNLAAEGHVLSEVMYQKKDGTPFYGEVSATRVVINDDEILVFGWVRDISERKQKEQQREHYTEKLEDEVQQKEIARIRQQQMLIQQSKMAAMGEMISAIAHQWRQPLNTLALLVQDFGDAYEYGEIDPGYLNRNIDRCMDQITYMSHTIDDFRNYYQPSKDAVNFSVQEAIISVFTLIYAQLKSSRILMGIQNVTIDEWNKPDACFSECGKDECMPEHICFEEEAKNLDDYEIYGYPNEFKQVILNIISNAKDAILSTPCTQIGDTAAGKVTVLITQFEKSVGVKIIDTGGGIPQKVMERIFEPYYTTKGDINGTGLGLYMSKVIIEDNMNGQLTCENIGNGACFTLELKKVSPGAPATE